MTIVEVSSFDVIDDDEQTEFTYTELSEAAKQKARDVTGWEEDFRDSCVESMKQDATIKFGSLDSWDLTYSIGFCQGDGVGIKGHMDATDIEDPEWVATVLPLLGAHKVRKKLGRHEVSWPRPIKDMRVEFEEARHGNCPQLAEHEMELTLVPLDDAETEDGYADDIIVNKYCADEAPEIWKAVSSYFIDACRKLYDEVTNWILDGDDEGMTEFCTSNKYTFDEDGDLI